MKLYLDNEKQTLSTNSKKSTHKKFIKSLTSFNPKKTITHHNTTSVKKTLPIKKEKSAKNKRVYLSR